MLHPDPSQAYDAQNGVFEDAGSVQFMEHTVNISAAVLP